MNDQITLRFNGHITAETSISTCPPGTPKKGENAPAPLPKMTVGGTLTPYFPGGGIRGTMRRRAVDLVRTTLMESTGSSPFSLDDHYYLVLGGIKGDDKEDKADIVGAEARRQANPIIGLFGAGDPWQSGRLYVSHAVPSTSTIEVEAVRGARVDDFARSGDNLRVLSLEEQQEWLKIARINALRSAKAKEQKSVAAKLRDKKIVEDERKALDAQYKALEAEIKAFGEESGYTNAINRPLDGYEIIPQGTEMQHSLTLSFANENEIGLLISMLRFWALDPWIGAHRAHGCGIVSGVWDVSVRVGYGASYEPKGSVTMTPFGGITGPDWLMEAEEKFLSALRKNEGFEFKYPVKAA